MNGLEKLKTIRHIHDMECGKDKTIDKDFDIIEKELKALEIIKEKKVNCYLLINSENLKDYNECVDDTTEKRLTQEEYDLLKEELK